MTAALTGVSATGYGGARVKLRRAYALAPLCLGDVYPLSLPMGEPRGAHPYRPSAFLCAATVEQTTYTFAAANPGPVVFQNSSGPEFGRLRGGSAAWQDEQVGLPSRNSSARRSALNAVSRVLDTYTLT